MHKVHSIFPFPIYRADMKQKITEHDIDYIKNQKQNLKNYALLSLMFWESVIF